MTEFTPEENLDALERDDLVLCVRDGSLWLRFPQHDAGEVVPDDVLILMGVAALFQNPSFRAAMVKQARRSQELGELSELLSNPSLQ